MEPSVTLSPSVRHHLTGMMERRGARVDLDRFEHLRIPGAAGALHLDVLDMGAERTVVFVPGTAVYGLVFADFLAELADHGCNVVSFDSGLTGPCSPAAPARAASWRSTSLPPPSRSRG
jgi:hypothetical protein